MKIKKVLLTGLSAALIINIAAINNINAQAVKPEPAQVSSINPLELVQTPTKYLNAKIKIKATFDKFSLLGLDYKPAFRDSKKYVSFLISRPDIKEYTIPLSELKLILKREKAEKLIDLETGDVIEFTGQVFSTALGDPWVDVENVTVISTKSTKNVSDKKINKEIKKPEKLNN